ncbi:protein of unknown function DUF134 [Pyrobaculum islandicum DSM 4184]|uniref:DUF134 domain-containing protein n=1 Tax=Pyrobaculum islandicum (strain DSM 4184 / JCM 9189 / GEO3) TaxID=384616 RepID=A1RW20_PYRIL|nr:DUF134 domain-containing protein [Pyrobaculum islandicum]ABL89152.1 protein of unknown function DUF134 [Pyrobaculum islandicum DSM 4184]
MGQRHRRRHRHSWGLAGARTEITTTLPFEELLYIPIKEAAGLHPTHYIELCSYEIEAMYLIHVAGLTTEEAAERVGVSKATFWRILEQARHKVARALAERLPLKLVSCKKEGPP